MQPQQNIIDCYNKTAGNYAGKFIDELSRKHLDRILLKAFAEENSPKGKMIDLGCGPGQTTKYLFDLGVTDIIGTDISPGMISEAKKMNPALNFETANMLALPYAGGAFASAVAFYSIVHFDYEAMAIAFSEVKRILQKDGQFLFCFHTGNNIVHLDNFLDHPVDIDFYFFDLQKVKDALTATGFTMIDIIEREHYNGFEYASKRAYIWAANL